MSLPEQIKEKCQGDNYDMVDKYNTRDNAASVQSPNLLSLITSLSAFMLQVKRVADEEMDAAELQARKESVADIQATLNGDSVQVFQDCAEVHKLQGFRQMGNSENMLTCMSTTRSRWFGGSSARMFMIAPPCAWTKRYIERFSTKKAIFSLQETRS